LLRFPYDYGRKPGAQRLPVVSDGSKLAELASLHAQTYGEAVDAVTLIPHILEAFIARDRAFRKSMRP